ncbi:NUDIX hydrolase [Lysobacter xanthus]
MTDDRDAPLHTLHEGRWLRLVQRGRWEFAERVHGHGMAVIIIAMTPDDEVLFVEQFRVPLGKKTIEMPAGLVGDERDDDTLAEAARRELIEETGYAAAEVRVLLTGPTSSGMSSERIAFVRATGLTKVGEGGGVHDEQIIVHRVPRTEAPAWLMRMHAQGYEVDLKLWGGLWMLEREPDGSPIAPPPSRPADGTAA